MGPVNTFSNRDSNCNYFPPVNTENSKNQPSVQWQYFKSLENVDKRSKRSHNCREKIEEREREREGDH